MKLSTIYRRAAKDLAQRYDAGRIGYCCTATDRAARSFQTGDTLKAKTFFSEFLKPSRRWEGDAWWSEEFDDERSAQHPRVIALLLAAEIASDEERAARKTARNSKSNTTVTKPQPHRP